MIAELAGQRGPNQGGGAVVGLQALLYDLRRQVQHLIACVKVGFCQGGRHVIADALAGGPTDLGDGGAQVELLRLPEQIPMLERHPHAAAQIGRERGYDANRVPLALCHFEQQRQAPVEPQPFGSADADGGEHTECDQILPRLFDLDGVVLFVRMDQQTALDERRVNLGQAFNADGPDLNPWPGVDGVGNVERPVTVDDGGDRGRDGGERVTAAFQGAQHTGRRVEHGGREGRIALLQAECRHGRGRDGIGPGLPQRDAAQVVDGAELHADRDRNRPLGSVQQGRQGWVGEVAAGDANAGPCGVIAKALRGGEQAGGVVPGAGDYGERIGGRDLLQRNQAGTAGEGSVDRLLTGGRQGDGVRLRIGGKGAQRQQEQEVTDAHLTQVNASRDRNHSSDANNQRRTFSSHGVGSEWRSSGFWSHA